MSLLDGSVGSEEEEPGSFWTTDDWLYKWFKTVDNSEHHLFLASNDETMGGECILPS